MDRSEDTFDGLTFTFGDREFLVLVRFRDPLDRLGLTFRLEHTRLFDTFGLQDRRPLLAFRLGDDGASLPLRLHLSVHCLGDVRWWFDPLDLDADDSRAPHVGCVVEYLPELRVDPLARCESLVELKIADDVTEVRLGELRRRHDEVGDVVLELHRVRRLVVDDCVDRDNHVVFCDDFLRGHVDDLLPHVYPLHRLDERDDEVQAGIGGSAELSEPLDESFLVLADDLDGVGHIKDRERCDDDQENDRWGQFHSATFLLFFRLVRRPVGSHARR
ncbi:hypothetical protein BMS3Abin02_02247 [bacterium BMS3Abin02]|nr:hypothetical protein BMS3Abin02_02247 [bacterium BMS3Abin02]